MELVDLWLLLLLPAEVQGHCGREKLAEPGRGEALSGVCPLGERE